MQKLFTFFFFSKNISVNAINNDHSFNGTLTNDVVSFEQLSPGLYSIAFVLLYLNIEFYMCFNVMFHR